MTKKHNTHNDAEAIIGADILSLITCGTYTNPLTIYREYIQNAADSITKLTDRKNARVDIVTDIKNMSVTIHDNGVGLSHTQAKQQLVPVSLSQKKPTHDRGFRGIGRLSGLAFAKSVTFLTRQNKKSPVTQIIWDNYELKNGIDRKLSLKEIISKCVTITKPNANSYPDNFFEVHISGISRQAATLILNTTAVHEYIGDVCPVPFTADFPYASHILKMFGKNQHPLELNVYLNGSEVPITRLHQNGVQLKPEQIDHFLEFKKIKIPALAEQECAAIGWIAHASYLGALPKKSGVRCLRARVGNIQIGNETIFDHLFTENRFNRWCVGEIHILDERIIPNGRRDYFEPNTHLRNLENHLKTTCREIELQCRISSKKRNEQKKYHVFLGSIKETYKLANSGYLDTNVAERLVEKKLSEVASFRKKDFIKNNCNGNDNELNLLEKQLNNFQPPGKDMLDGIPSSKINIYRNIFATITELSSSPLEAKETIEAILKQA